MIALFYDTETTGLPLFKEPSEDPRQPHLVQLAACLADTETQGAIASMNVIVRPAGWQIPDDVAAIHGISTEYALRTGVSESLAVELLLELWGHASVRIAHNESFDARIVRIAMMRHQERIGRNPDDWKAGSAACTQLLSTPILKLPPTAKMAAVGRHHFKSANLGEAYRHFTGAELVGAHQAMADVKACMAVWFAIKALPQEAPK